MRDTAMRNGTSGRCLGGSRRPSALALVVCLWFLAAGCGERPPDISHHGGYSSELISFNYPGNWRIFDEQKSDFPVYAEIQSPWNATLSVLVFRSAGAPRLDEFIAEYRDFFRLKTEIGDEAYTGEPPRLSKATVMGGFETVTEKLKVASGRRDVPCTRTYRRKKEGGYVCFVIEQCSDANLATVAPGFALVTGSVRFGNGPAR
ncbi:MAG: hypothetical protein JXD23_06065 [Spirochaetales bacterium]|nr:hypothetical protein [Spirochaetales bacterium]